MNQMMKKIMKILVYAGESSFLVYNSKNFTENKIIRRILKFIATPFCVAKYFFVPDVPERKGFALVLIVKNEAPYVEEWINFHEKQGVCHFIIYDNESTDNLHDVLLPYIESDKVSYHRFKGKLPQNEAYNSAMAEYGKKFKYIGVIDADEFLFVRSNFSLRGGGGYNLFDFVDKFMTEHKNAGGIGVNWLIFGSNHFEKKPEGGVLKNFTMCAEKDFPINRHIKTICDPLKVLAWRNPHYPFYRKGFQNLDENGNPIDEAFTNEVHFEKIRINHYYSKSKEEFIAKKDKGNAVGVALRDMNNFVDLDQNVIKDTEILALS